MSKTAETLAVALAQHQEAVANMTLTEAAYLIMGAVAALDTPKNHRSRRMLYPDGDIVRGDPLQMLLGVAALLVARERPDGKVIVEQML